MPPTYETSAGLPTRGLTYAKMLDHLREAQTCASLMAHLMRAEGSSTEAQALSAGWLAVSELLDRTVYHITHMAMGRLN